MVHKNVRRFNLAGKQRHANEKGCCFSPRSWWSFCSDTQLCACPVWVGLLWKTTLEVFVFIACLKGNLEILVRSLKILILFDLEFPLVGIYPRHRVGDVDKYLQGAFAAFFLIMKSWVSSWKSKQDETLAGTAVTWPGFHSFFDIAYWLCQILSSDVYFL